MVKDYRKIDVADPSIKHKEKKFLKKTLKVIVSLFIFLPIVFLIFVAFYLDKNIPSALYLGLGLFYMALFVTIFIMFLVFPH
jgi:hypothetical protein